MDLSLKYNGGQLMSYNRILNFVNGGRGIGKTFFYKEYAVKKFIEKGEQFIYVRRTKQDLKKVKQFFEGLIKAGKFVGHTFKVLGRELYVDNKLAGWAIPLTAWQSEKSTEYPNVYIIIYDEFLLEKSNVRYLPNEVESFLNLLDTVIRDRDNVRVYCLSNATTIANPYYLYFRLFPDPNKRFNKCDDIMVEIPDSTAHAEARESTPFGRLIRSTDYAAMSMDNSFTHDNYDMIKKKTNSAKFNFIIKDNGKNYGVWFDPITTHMYITKKHNSNAKLTITCNADDLAKDIVYCRSVKDHHAVFRIINKFKKCELFYENLEIRKVMYDILNKWKCF